MKHIKFFLLLISLFFINNNCFSYQKSSYWQYLIKRTKNRNDANHLKKIIRYKESIQEDSRKPLFRTLRKFDFSPEQINVLFAQMRHGFGNSKANKIINSSRLPFKLSPNQICKGYQRKAFYNKIVKQRTGSPADVILSPMGNLLCIANFYWD